MAAITGTSNSRLATMISIVAFSIVGRQEPLVMVGSRLLLVPVIAAIGYEILRFGAKHRANPLVKAIMAPGMLVQMITTKQPSDDQIEIAIVSMEQALEADGEQVPENSELPERQRLEADPAAAAA